jgi:hypothetical protein
MAHYELVQRCRPIGSYRLKETVAFLSLLRDATEVEAYELAKRTFEPDEEGLRLLFESLASKSPFPEAGVDVDLYGRMAVSQEYLRVEIHSGTRPGEAFIDHVNVDLGGNGRGVSETYFRRAIDTLRPFEAYVAELDDEHELDSYGSQQRIVDFNAPAIIRSLHFLDVTLAASVGGIERCLAAPASRVERVLGGVLIRLVNEPFDPRNPTHLGKQREVMEYLGLPAPSAVQESSS